MQNSLSDLIRNHMNSTSSSIPQIPGGFVTTVEKEEPLPVKQIPVKQIIKEFSNALSEPADKGSVEISQYIINEVDDLLAKFEVHCSHAMTYLANRRETAVNKIIKSIAANSDFKVRFCVEEAKQLFCLEDNSLGNELRKFFPTNKVKIVVNPTHVVIGLHDWIAHPFSHTGEDEELIALL